MGCSIDSSSTPAIATQLRDVRGVTYYDGFVYFLDAGCGALYRLHPATNIAHVMAGQPGSTGFADGVGAGAQFESPRYMTSDNSGLLFIADTNGQRLRTYNTTTGEVTTFAGDGTAAVTDGIGTSAQIHRPRGMTSDGTSIYFVEFNMHVVRQGVIATQEVSTMLGVSGMNGYFEGVGAAARLTNPFAMAFHWPTNSLFALDGGNNVIRRIR